MEKKTSFCCGPEPTFVDFCVYQVLSEQEDLQPHLKEYVARVEALPDIHAQKEPLEDSDKMHGLM